MHDLPHLPYCNYALMALCMSMWMCVHGIKQRKYKINTNSNMWKANKRTYTWNKDLKPWIHENGSKIEVYMWKKKKKKLGFIKRVLVHAWTTLRAHNQACMHRQDYAYVGFCPETLET